MLLNNGEYAGPGNRLVKEMTIPARTPPIGLWFKAVNDA
jgi:hypothetical protein